MSDIDDLETWKVAELQNELKKRGLETKGRKADLINRLRDANHHGEQVGETTTTTGDANVSDDGSAVVDKGDTSSPSSAIEDDDEEEDADDDEQPSHTEPVPMEQNVDQPTTTSDTHEPLVQSTEQLHMQSEVQSSSGESSEVPPIVESLSLSKKRRLSDDETKESSGGDGEEEEGEDDDSNDRTHSNEPVLEKNQQDENNHQNNNNENEDSSKQRRKKKSRWGAEQDESSPEKQPTTTTTTTTKRTSDDDDPIGDNSSTTSSRHRDHHRSSKQRDDDRHSSSRRSEKSPEKEVQIPVEETVEFNNDDVVLDFYTADLNLAISADCLSASSKTSDALCFLWGGARTTYGFKQGKICFEIRITEIIDCPQMPDSEKEKFGIRIGWSNLASGLNALQLGEFNDSFTYNNVGKKISSSKIEMSEDIYGETFNISDIIGCYVDFDHIEDEKKFVRIFFSKNGQDCGLAFQLDKTTTFDNDEQRWTLFPHILVKNAKIECNFGQLETPWAEMKADYVFAQQIPLTERVRSSEPIVEKADCQVMLLSGLIAAGKTAWATKYMTENKAKNFNLLNIEHVLSKMTIDGSKGPVVKDRNDGLMLRLNIALQKLIEIAPQRRRNYIIDQANASRDTQLKHQKLFTGYQRTAVVIVPDDDQYRIRVEKVEKAENISIPSQWLRDSKAKFHFAQKSSTLEDVLYPELSYEEAKLLFDRARRDSDQHRSSSRSDRQNDDHRSSRDDSSRSNRNRYDDRDRSSRDRDRDRHDRHDRSRSRDRDRDRDRRTSREDARFSSSHRNDYGSGGNTSNNYRGGYSRGGHSDHRQDSRNTSYNQRGGGGFHHEGGGGFHGRGGGGGGFNNQQNDGWRGGYHQQQRGDFGSGGRGRGGGSGGGDFRGGYDNNRSQFNNRSSFHDNPRGGAGSGGGGGGFRPDFNNQQRGRQFNDFDTNPHHQGSSGFQQTNNNFNPQHDRQGFGPRPQIQQQPQHGFHTQQQPQPQQQQQRPQPLLQNPPANQQQQQQVPSHHQQHPHHLASHQQQASGNTNTNLPLQTSNPLGLGGGTAGVAQQNPLDPWLALYAAALNPQAAQQQQQQQPQQQVQPQQQDANSVAQQWAQWLKTAQMAQSAQQAQSQIAVQQPDIQQQQSQISDASALYYQAYYAQLAAVQQQAAAAAAAAAAAGGSTNGAVAPSGVGDKPLP